MQGTEMVFGSSLFVIAAVIFVLLVVIAKSYKKVPPNKVMVIYGVGAGGKKKIAKIVTGGGAWVIPFLQSAKFLDLSPITIDIDLKDALSKQNIRINVPSTFTVAISPEEGVVENAAQRLLGLTRKQIEDLAKDIIYGQMRVVIASMPIETIISDRETFVEKVTEGVETELRKVGLKLINVNVKDIIDSSGYIDALGKEAAAKAINEAKVKVAIHERDGEIGKAEAEKEMRIKVAEANATAVEGETEAQIRIAFAEAHKREKEAEAQRQAITAEKVQMAKALEEAYEAEKLAELKRAEKEKAKLQADVIVKAEVEKQEKEIRADAEAEVLRRKAKGEADATLMKYEAEAEGIKKVLVSKAEGYKELFASTGDPNAVVLLYIAENLPDLVDKQVEAIKNLKIDKVVVWDSGGSTARFVSGLVGALPPLKDLLESAGMNLADLVRKEGATDQHQEDQG